MKVNVRSFAFIREALGKKQVQIEVRNGVSIEDAIMVLIQENEALKKHLIHEGKLKKDFVYALNGNQIQHENLTNTTLSENDTIVILPPAGGG